MTTVFQRVGPYEILREIGRGGMAAVFLADDARHGRQVALKLVPIGEDREAKEILDAERWGARLQAKFAEACALVPRVYEDGDEPPYYFIAMEYVRGENLSDIIARGPVAASEGARIGLGLSQFLHAAHQFKASIDGREFWSLVHGDLKPRNVRIAEDGSIKVLDFGIAKALSVSRKVTRNDFGSMVRRVCSLRTRKPSRSRRGHSRERRLRRGRGSTGGRRDHRSRGGTGLGAITNW